MSSAVGGRSRAELAAELNRSVGDLTTAAVAAMERTYPWFHELSAENRSWISSVAHSGIIAFIEWFRDPTGQQPVPNIFSVAPDAMARVVSLQQTVALVRTTISVVDARADDICGPADGATVRSAVSLYASEVAFDAAEVYARAAESRGAWDARLEALVVDTVLRAESDESLGSRAAALGWTSAGDVTVLMGPPPQADLGLAAEAVIANVRRAGRRLGVDVMCSVQGERLVVILGGVDHPDKAAKTLSDEFGPGAVVLGPRVPDLQAATASARAAAAALRAAPGWPDAPRPVHADDLLAERALSGDGHARRALVDDVYTPLRSGDGVLLQTVAAFVESGCSVEATARLLFVHPNTVRYRLRKTAAVTDLDPLSPRDAYTLRIAITLGRLRSTD
ncbi:PucR family transcriptional regulator [Solicola gregarius]|uniref:Helix-turn-helix domain-containing protein n=1 Tax=Solicola gregarius TaxID=2908642 RepID=A0AA46TI72_9ACTN|nr:helix-turn-helix domain-containing protein [Solicola gregarius]UYM05613.1 helix-turn-helix domain-containing protein [Solicola gregarius]